MALPNFLGIGAEKAGTTALWFLLRQHPDIFLFEQKETLHFSRERNFVPPHHYELTLFKNYGGQRAVGEISPEYIRTPGAARAIREALGPIKIIICLREPLRRAFSHYLLCLRIAEENRSFREACAADARLRLWSADFMDMRRAYIRGSWYAYQIEAWKREFGAENLFYMILERDLASRGARARMLKRLFRFLDVSETAEIDLDPPSTSFPAPRVVFASQAGAGRLANGAEIPFAAGDLILQTGNVGLNRILRRPSPALRAFFEKMAREMTPRLLPDDEAEHRSKYFATTAEETSEIVGEDLTALWAARQDPASAVPNDSRLSQRSRVGGAAGEQRGDELPQIAAREEVAGDAG